MDAFSSYFDKRDEFVAACKLASTEVLRQKVLQAIFLSDLAITTFVEFIQSLEMGMDDLARKEDDFAVMNRQNRARAELLEQLPALNPEADKKLEALYKAAEKNEDDEVLKSLGLRSSKEVMEEMRALLKQSEQDRENLLAASKKTSEDSEKLAAVLSTLKNFFLQIQTEELESSLFDGVFKARDSRSLVDAMLNALDYLLGLIPSPLPDPTRHIIGEIKTIYQERVETIKVNDDYLRYVETYSLTAIQWSLTAQIMIDTIYALMQSQQVSLAISDSMLSHRTQKLKNGWNYELPVMSKD